MIRFALISLMISTELICATDFFGNHFDHDAVFQTRMDGSTTEFISPNERNVEDALGIFQNLSKGAYLSVGTERGFFAAASSPLVTDLILVDIGDPIPLYNQLNLLLLKMANGRKEYLRLRLTAKWSEWLARAKAEGIDDDLFLDKRSFDWWQQFVRNNSEFATLHQYDSLNYRLPDDFIPFDEVSYLEFDEPFNKLSKMAKENRIHVVRGNLTLPDFINQLIDRMRTLKIKLSAFDISNGWETGYSNSEYLAETIMKLKTVATPNAYFVTTDIAIVYHQGKYHGTWDATRWSYRADKFSRFKSSKGALQFLYDLQADKLSTNVDTFQAHHSCDDLLRKIFHVIPVLRL